MRSKAACPLPPPSIPHQLKLSWPQSYNQVGNVFMAEWQAEAKSIGLSMRLTSHRNSAWKNTPAQAAGTYALTIIANDEENPPKQLMVQFLCDWAKAVSRRRVPAPAAPLPWDDIITWWDGQERMQCK